METFRAERWVCGHVINCCDKQLAATLRSQFPLARSRSLPLSFDIQVPDMSIPWFTHRVVQDNAALTIMERAADA